MGLFRRKRHGYWVETSHLLRPDGYECSECGRCSDKPYDECPYCGALMDLGTMDEITEMELLLDDDD